MSEFNFQKSFEVLGVTKPQKKILDIRARLSLWLAEANPATDDPIFIKEFMAQYEESEGSTIGERIMAMKMSFATQAQEAIDQFAEEYAMLINPLLVAAISWVEDNIVT